MRRDPRAQPTGAPRRSFGIMCLVALVAGLVLLPGLGDRAGAAVVPVVDPPPGGGAITSQTFTMPAIHLGAMGSGTDMSEGSGLVLRPVGAFGMKAVSFDLVDDQGHSLDRMSVFMHHFVIATVNRVDPACPSRTVSGYKVAPMVGTGEERTPISFPDPYAILVGPKDMWGAVWHLMNMTNTAQSVHIRYTIDLQAGATAANTRNLTPFWADSRSCEAGTEWNVPGNGGPGSVETDTRTWPMPADGIVVGIGGHLHYGGIDITTRHEDGSTICTNTATNMDMAGMHIIDSINPCPTHDTVTKGEQLTVTSRYDNSAPHAAVMGISVMFIWQGTQPAPPPTTTTSTTSTSTTSTSTSTTAPAPTTTAPLTDVLPVSQPAPPLVATPSFAG